MSEPERSPTEYAMQWLHEAERARQERDAVLAERDRLREIAEDLVDFVDHKGRCVQAGKPLMETCIGGDIPCTCGLSALVNALAEPAQGGGDDEECN